MSLTPLPLRSVLVETSSLLRLNFRAFLGLWALYCIGIFALLRSNVLYVNDTSRLLERGLFFKNVGRVISEAIGSVIFIPTADISPLTQIGTAACMAMAGIFICAALRQRRMHFRHVLSCVPLALFPYFLQNLSYKFDCIFMGMAVLCVSAAFYWLSKHGRKATGQLLGGLAIFISLGLYQPMINIFFVLAAFWCIDRLLQGRTWRSIACGLLRIIPAFAIALLAYKGMLSFIDLNAYTQAHSGMHSLQNLLSGIVDNVNAYVRYVLTDWAGNRIGAAIVAVLCMGMFCQLTTCCRLRVSPLQKVIRSMAVQGLYWLCVLTVPGLMLLLDTMVLEPRVLAPLGVYMAVSMLLFWHYAQEILRWVGSAVCSLFILYCFLFASAYGNALTIQYDFEQMIFSQMVMDMKTYSEQYTTTRVHFTGYMPRSPQLAKFEEDFPAVVKLVPVSLRNGDWHTPRKLSAWGIEVERMLPQEISDMQPRILRHTPFYDIGINSENILFLHLPFGRQDGMGR